MERKKIHQAQQAIVFSALLFTSIKVKSEPRDTTEIPSFSFYSQSTYSDQQKLFLKPLNSDLSQNKKNIPKFNFIANDELGKDSVAKWTLHIQVSTVYQYHPAFEVPYSGAKSLSNSADNALSITHTIFLGRKLWKNAAFYFNPELTGGNGFNGATGIAGFPNGEIYRVGNPTPTPFVARAFFQQIISLGNSEIENLSSDINQLKGKKPTSRIVISIGKFCLADFFDANSYNHDARTQFLNWSLMVHGAWDFPADTRGYTEGGVIELIKPMWSIRASSVAVPNQANHLPMEYSLNSSTRAHSETIEYERKWKLKNHPGTIRGTLFATFCRAPKYTDAINQMAKGDSILEKIISSEVEGTTFTGKKYGYGINIEQEIIAGVGIFSRWSWNDGHYATWAFTDIDRSLQLGFTIHGNYWKRAADLFGIAGVVNGLSPDHIDYLKAGGIGVIVGDGKLNYGYEYIMETFYRIQLAQSVQVSPDYQLVVNPAYNKDRKGPVNIYGIRIHVGF
jgi:hypothetical protein